MDAGRYRKAAGQHEAAAKTHDELAGKWKADGDADRADLERRNAELERKAAELQRDRAALADRRNAKPEQRRDGEGPPALTDEVVTLRAVEILRGTTYDFRVEATVDVVNLFGPHVLVAALERLDAEIEPRERSVSSH